MKFWAGRLKLRLKAGSVTEQKVARIAFTTSETKHPLFLSGKATKSMGHLGATTVSLAVTGVEVGQLLQNQLHPQLQGMAQRGGRDLNVTINIIIGNDASDKVNRSYLMFHVTDKSKGTVTFHLLHTQVYYRLFDFNNNMWNCGIHQDNVWCSKTPVNLLKG